MLAFEAMNELRRFSQAHPSARTFFYYSGHASRDGAGSGLEWAKGVEQGGNLPKIPRFSTEANRREADGRSEWFEFGGDVRLRDTALRRALVDGVPPDTTVVLIIDACHASGFANGVRNRYGSPTAKATPAPRGAGTVWLLCASEEFELSAAGVGENDLSPFTCKLLAALRAQGPGPRVGRLADVLCCRLQTPSIRCTHPLVLSPTARVPL